MLRTSDGSCFPTARRSLVGFIVAAVVLAAGFAVAPAADLGEPVTGVSVSRLTTDGRSYARRGFGWSPTSGHFAYYRAEQTGLKQLIVRTEHGDKQWQVTRLGAPSTAAWSPDGKHIAYVYAEKPEDQSEARVYVWSLDTGQSLEVAGGFRYHQFGYGTGYGLPVWSPDSRHFVCMIRRVLNPGENRFAAWVFAADGGAAVQLLPNHYHTGAWYPGSWSSDSQWFVACSYASTTSGRSLWVCRSDGSEIRELVKLEPTTRLRDPLWSPDSKWIAYGSDYRRTDARRMQDIWLVRPDGSDNHPVTNGTSDSTEGRMHFELYRWAPDSKRLCTVGWRLDALGVEHGGLYVVDVETRTLTQILANSRRSDTVVTDFDHSCAWDHAGKRLAFTAQIHERHGEPGPKQQLTDQRDVLLVYDVTRQVLTSLLQVRPRDDGRMLSRTWAWMPSWSPDDSKILFSDAKVISLGEDKVEPDLYTIGPLTAPADQTPEVTTPVALPPSPPSQTTAVTNLAEETATTPDASSQAPLPAAANAGLVTIFVKHRDVADVAALLPQTYAGAYTIDTAQNALIASGDQSLVLALGQAVRLLDCPVQRVMVDVLVVEMTKEGARELGLDWEYSHGRFGALLPLDDLGSAGEILYQGVGKLDRSFFARLSLLETLGKANVRANPRVLATSGTESIINIRRTNNFIYQSGTDGLGRPILSRSDISADTIVRIRPVVLDGGQISLSVDATVDSFIFKSHSDLPDTTRRQAATKLVCEDGETVIIGGLTLEEDTWSKSKTPLLGDLPLLGQLFRRTSRVHKTSDLTIFITPRRAPSSPGQVGSGH